MGQPYTMGDLGGIIVSSATGPSSDGVHTGLLCRSMQVIEEAVLAHIAINGVENDTLLETTIPVGVYLFGKGITAITVTSGLIYLAA